LRKNWDLEDQVVVFTNGCFDILHRGHAAYLQDARRCGDILVVGVNSDASTRRLKGDPRPLMGEADRAYILAALEAVDYVCIFEEDTPQSLIEAVQPDVLVKGGDYQIAEIVGREVVEARGGRVLTIPLTPDRSTSDMIQKIVALVQKGILK
jgi:rfaE bifunctional protein nucleotidyltransferase chain/domain